MSQDITLLGASYSDVPAVTLPKTGGGTARFTDTSPTTATDADVASGKIYFKSDGTQSTGTGSGGSATLITKSITANGTYNASADNADGYSSVTVNVSGGGGAVSESDVNFYDYDGALVASHTKAEINAMTAESDLPANPSHSGLTAQGWNWTLAQLKTQLTAMPDQPVNVGQMYVTDDDKTRIYVHFEKGRTSPYFGICPNGTVTIDWGDGSSTSTLTGTSLSSVKRVQHVWPDVTADYMITLEAASGTTFAFLGTSNGTNLLTKENANAGSSSRVYANAIKKIELGSAAAMSTYAFCYCMSMESITVPSTSTGISQYAFQYCYSLRFVTQPAVLSLSQYAFRYCYSLQCVALSPVLTTIGNYAFANCSTLPSISIPAGVTSVGSYSFNSCGSLAFIIIPSGVTIINSNIFQSCTSLASIPIPSGVTSISGTAFSACHCLASVTIPSSVTSIAAQAFNGCYGLGEIHFKPSSPPTVANSNAWTNVQSDCKIYVPSGSLSAYTSATNYPSSSTYTYIEE